MSKRNRKNRLFRIRQRITFVLVVAFCLISLSPPPEKYGIPDFHWSFMGFFFAMVSAFIYLLNESVGPNYGDDGESNDPR